MEPKVNFRVQRFLASDTGSGVAAQGEFAASILHGSVNEANEAKNNTTEVAVDAAGRSTS